MLNDKGYVVTNYHVLSGNERLEIMHDNEIIPYVDIIGIDVEKDILILKIDEKIFPAIKIGDIKKLKVGQRVYAIGSPMGYENTISEGIISGLRSYEELSKNYIQITASISPGSSGGAVINDKGELIGISTSTIQEGQNLNFAIPIDDVLSVEIGSYSKGNIFKDFELFDKGLIASKNGNHNEAIKYYSLFIEKYPDMVGAYINRGFSKCDIMDFKGAIEDLNTAIKLSPLSSTAYLNRGFAKYKLSDYRGAIQDCNKAIEINPNDYEAYYSRGTSKNKLEDYIGAIQDFNKAIKINPNDASVYFNRAIAKYELGDTYGACLDWSKSGELGNYNAYELIREYCN